MHDIVFGTFVKDRRIAVSCFVWAWLPVDDAAASTVGGTSEVSVGRP